MYCWDETLVEFLGATVRFLHASDGSVAPLPSDEEQHTSLTCLDQHFTTAVLRAISRKDSTADVQPLHCIQLEGEWYQRDAWAAMTHPSRLVYIGAITQITALVPGKEGLFVHDKVAYAKLFIFTFEELGVELQANNLSVCMSNLQGLLKAGSEQQGTDTFPWSITKSLSPNGCWAWQGHNLVQLVHDDTLSFRPIHYVGLHEEAEGGDSIMRFTYR